MTSASSGDINNSDGSKTSSDENRDCALDNKISPLRKFCNNFEELILHE
jgi:hypothetical protein